MRTQNFAALRLSLVALGLTFAALPSCWGQAADTAHSVPQNVPSTGLPAAAVPDLPTQASGGPTTQEQARTTQEAALARVLSQLDAAATLMGRGHTPEAIAAYLPALQSEPDFAALNALHADLTARAAALQQQVFGTQRQRANLKDLALDPQRIQSAELASDALAAQQVALSGQLQAIQKLLAMQEPFAEAHANLAHLLVSSGAIPAGLREYAAAIRLRPALKTTLRPALLHAHLAEADRLAKLGRPEAAAEYRDALALDPADSSAHLGLGSLLLTLGKPKDAVPELLEAVRRDPASTDAALTLGLAYYRSGQEMQARQQWRSLTRSADPRAAEEAEGMLARYLLAPVLASKPLLDVREMEVSRCRETVRNYPDQAYAHNNLALALYHTKQKDEALLEVQTALRLNPDSLEAHTNLGMFLNDRHLADDAVEQYKQALRLDSDNGPVHNNLGVVYFGRQQWKQAEYEFRKALEGDRADPYAHHNLADTLLQEGRLPESIKECGKTLQYDPAFVAAYGTRGLVEDRMGDDAKGLADLRHAVSSALDPVQALLDLAEPLRQFAGPRRAAAQFGTLLRLYPPTAEGEETWGRLLLAGGRDRDAAVEFASAIRLQPDRAPAHFQLARALLRLSQTQGAIKEARTALALDPLSAEAMNTLGLALYESGQTAEGRALWQKAQKSDNKDAAHNAAGLLDEFP